MYHLPQETAVYCMIQINTHIVDELKPRIYEAFDFSGRSGEPKMAV